MVCAQQWHTTIELSHPAEISLPLEVSDLLLVNNTVAHPDLPTGAFYTLMAAAETLEGSDYLPSVLETSQNASGSLYRKQLLSNTQADSLLTLYQSQALLVLNQLIVHPSTEGFPTDNDTYYACMQAIAAAHWTLFFRSSESGALHSRTLMYADTLYWESEALSQSAAVEALPDADRRLPTAICMIWVRMIRVCSILPASSGSRLSMPGHSRSVTRGSQRMQWLIVRSRTRSSATRAPRMRLAVVH